MSGARFTPTHRSRSLPAPTLTTALLSGILLLATAHLTTAQAQARSIGGEEALLNHISSPSPASAASDPATAVVIDGAWALTMRHTDGSAGRIESTATGEDVLLPVTGDRALRNAVALRTEAPESQP